MCRVDMITKDVADRTIANYILLYSFFLILSTTTSCTMEKNPMFVVSSPFEEIIGGADGHQDSNQEFYSDGPSIPQTPKEALTHDAETVLTQAGSDSASTADSASKYPSKNKDSSIIKPLHDPDAAIIEDASDVDEPTGCDLRGIYGGKITVDTYWGGRNFGLVGLVDQGRGPIVIHFLYRIEEVSPEGKLSGTIRTCNIEFPPFYSTILCETYLPVFDAKTWESLTSPTFPFTATSECTNPGCTIHMDTVTALLGVELLDPNSAWPSADKTNGIECENGTGAECFIDHDGDGYPGITVNLPIEGIAPPENGCVSIFGSSNQDYQYKGAPLDANTSAILGYPVPRTDRIHIGMRAFFGGHPVITDDCTGAKGKGVADGFDSRSVSCMIQPGMPTGQDSQTAGSDTLCDDAQRQFMDENLPLYHCLQEGDIPDPNLIYLVDKSISSGPQISIVRLGKMDDIVSCEDVRNTDY